MSSNSYRIRTTVGGGENVINVNLKQKVKTLNILSLEIEPEDEYDIHTSDYGVIVGRVLANNAFGVPNVKVSVFIPISSDDESDYVISNEYPYKTPQSKDINGVKYNLVLKKKDGPGTFVDKNTMLDNEGYREVYDKYWTYTTTTNQSGDYMIFGVPTGSTQIHYDCDLSDIGMLSQHPYDLVAKGYDANLFDSMNEFTAKDLNSAVHIISQDKTVYVYPFWGDKNANKIGITRADIDLNYKFEPSCVFMGSSITDPQGSYVGIDGQPNGSNGRFNSLTTSVGDIEIIRKTQDGRVEGLKENVVGIIDGNGVWCYQIPMNLDRIGTDEYGNIIAINDPERGIPTRARVRFRISLTDAKNESVSEYTAKFLIPCNPPLRPQNGETYSRSAQINYDAFSKEDWDNIYEFGDKTPDSCFRDLYWGKVYSVKQYYLRYQYEYEPKIVGYGDATTYDTNEELCKPETSSSFKDFPYVGKNAYDTGDRPKEEKRRYDYSNFSTRNAFKMSCISSIDNINGLNAFPYNTMYSGAEEHINNGTIYWFRYHFTSESSDASYPNKGLHFCFENDWVNGCLYFPRMIIKRNTETEYDYFGRKTDDGGNQVSENNSYPYVWISGRHNYRLADDKDEFVLPDNLEDTFMSRWAGTPYGDNDDCALVHWPYTHTYEALFYAFSRCRMMGGGLTKKNIMIGQNVFYYRCGIPIHKRQYETVDLDLPSKTRWAKCNLGAEKETDAGLFYQWGDYVGYTGNDEQNFNQGNYIWYYNGGDTMFSRWTKYNDTDKKVTLDNEDDAVYAATEGAMRMPTKEQLLELIYCTVHKWTSIDGVNGMKFWKKNTEEPTDSDSYIFIPAAGYFEGTSLESKGEICDLWSNTRKNESQAYHMEFSENEDENALEYSGRFYGFTLRGVCQDSTINNNTTRSDEEDFRRMYATDVILLGNLEDIYDSLPKLYESLPSTTTTFPPMSPPESLIEAGMTWAGYPGQYENFFTKRELWDDRIDIFGNNEIELANKIGIPPFDPDMFVGYNSEYAVAFLTEAIAATGVAFKSGAYNKYVENDEDNQWIYQMEESSKERLTLDILLGMLNRRYSLFFGVMNSGGISAFLSYVPAAFVNLSRICELDVHNDTAFKTKLLNEDFKLEDVIIPINGLIDSFDITTNDNRSQFASMNYDINKRDKVDFVYKQYVATPMSMSSFDGRLQGLIDNTKTYGLTYPTDQVDESYMEFRFRNPYIPEGQKCIMHNFRAYFNFGDFVNLPEDVSGTNSKARFLHNVNYCNDHMVLTENSFYFYFGLRTGFSAIDVLRSKFIGKLKEEKHTINQLTVIRGQQECINENLYISYSLTSRDMTLPIEVYVYNKDNNLVFFQEYASASDPITFSIVPGIYHVIVVDSLGKQYQKYFSATEEELPIGAIGYFEKEKDDESQLVDVSELTLNTINNLPIISIEENESGKYIANTDSDSRYFVTFEGGNVSSVTGNVVRFNNIAGITIKVTDYNATCFKGETYVTFKEHINPDLFLNNVPIKHINYWSGDGSGYTIENGVPDYVFKNTNFKVWDSINTAHPYRSNRTYSDVLKENLNNGFKSVSIAYVSNMCSSVFGGSSISLQDANHSSIYKVQGIYLNYNASKYEHPQENWGQETQLPSGIQRAVINGVEPDTEPFRNAPHIIGTNYPRRKNLASQKTFLKNSALNPDGSLGESGYTNNQLYVNYRYGSRNPNADSYFGNGIFGIYLLGLRYKTFSELDEPGPLYSVPKITGNTISSYYLVNNNSFSGVTNYYGIRTVDKRMDYQFALKTPLLLPSGIEFFQNLEYNNLVSGEMRIHLYGGFRLNYDKTDMKLDYKQGQGPDFDADLYSVTITEDNTEDMLSYGQTKQCIWGCTQSETSGTTDVDYEVYDISGNTMHGHSKVQLTFTDCSTSFKLGEPVRQGNSEKFSVSYRTPIQILPPDRSKACHISYVIQLGSQNYEAKLESLPFSIKGDSLWPGETYTHSNTNGQTYYENGCDDAVYAATNGEMTIPTKEQMEELLKETNHKWTNIDGIFGAKFWEKGKAELTDEDPYLFIPAGGYWADDIYQEEDSSVCVWSSTRDDENENLALSLHYTESGEREYERYYGLNLRGVAPSGYTGSDVVDLGLSVKWAKYNFGAASETDSGEYYQWGDINGYENNEPCNDFSWDSYIFGVNPNKYNDTDKIYVLTEKDDAVYKVTEGEMIMPTKDQIEELLEETNHEWTSINGVNGMKFWSGGTEPMDSDKYLFIPAGGYFEDGERYGINAQLRLWSSERVSDNYYQSYIISGDSGSTTTCSVEVADRYLGFNLRGVATSIDSRGNFVDLGLSVKWAKCNLGATSETDFGEYYQWGDINGYRDVFHNFRCNDYLWTCDPTKYNQDDFVCNLQSEDDAVYAATNGIKRMPTKEQMKELLSGTTHEWTTIDGVNGMKFTSKNDETKYIFIPAGGYFKGIDKHRDSVDVWTSSRDEEYDKNAYRLKAYYDTDYREAIYKCIGNDEYGDQIDCGNGLNVRGVAPSGYTGSDVVDLGLPSGTQWAKCNLGAVSETDFGEYYQWANISGYTDSEIGVGGYNFVINQHPLYDEDRATLKKYGNYYFMFQLENCDDVIYMTTNGKMRIPTKEQIEELLEKTYYKQVTISGTTGVKFWKLDDEEPSDDGSYLFIPAGGYFKDGVRYDKESYVCLWSNCCDVSDYEKASGLYVSSPASLKADMRYYGLNLRGVAPSGYTGNDVVDLGLPSGTQWAKCNLGTENEISSGKYYQWGDVNGYSSGNYHNFDSKDYIWGNGDESLGVTKYNSDDNKRQLDTKTYLPWIQTYADTIPYSVEDSSDISVYLCQPLDNTTYKVSQSLKVAYVRSGATYFDSDRYIVPYYKSQDNTMIPVNDANANGRYKYSTDISDATLDGDTFLVIPTKTVYSTMMSSRPSLSTLLKQGVSYNVGSAYFAGGVSHSRISDDVVTVQLNTPLRRGNGTINYESTSLKQENKWHTIGNISQWWSDTGEISYDPNKIEFTYRRGQINPSDVFYFSIENGLTYQVTLIFQENAVQDSTEPEA